MKTKPFENITVEVEGKLSPLANIGLTIIKIGVWILRHSTLEIKQK